MRVIVAGATGTLGMTLTEQLIAAGHSVIGLCRRPEGADRLTVIGAEPVVADVLDEHGLLTALTGHRADAVIHQATALSRMPITHSRLDETNALRDIGTSHLLLAAAAVGARRFLTQSFFLGYGYRDHGSEPVTEEHLFGRPDGSAFDRHLRSMRSNEDQVFAARGIDGIALRYGLFYGPEPTTRRFAASTRARRLPVPARAGITSPIHIFDAAAATVAALERGRGGEAYNVADDCPLGFDDYIRAIARASDAPEPRRIPGWLLRPAPYLYGLMVGTSIRLSNEKAKRELGWTPRYASCHEGLAALDVDDYQIR
ncbi:NAD-dependent epimerase/dehydratase family protein [Nocardia cyriacigeorgica]|uniref:NAD-dependent epimerase/dehydratase family protein n=2 Tax=Nocardia cyriacigeorgica TaxID=135487 RepID=UPI0013D21B3E|nr:NAD(P)-dependent oxidoreductase [Nocardia cyriacigeorgica]NEW28842.1 NAD(P)-dependent oxidoreductase [Nocardia cyriacigeorgica]